MEQPLHILLVDENKDEASLLRGFLTLATSDNVNLIEVDRLEKARQAIEVEMPDIILLDLELPDSSGLESYLQLQTAAPNLPIMVLTALHNEALGLRAVSAGAQDYLFKGEIPRPERLLRSIRYAIERKRSELKLQEAHRKLQSKHEEIQSFYHTLSHELKTPLTSAREFIAILLDGLAGPLNETQQEYLGIARESCDQIRMCLDDLLDTTRLETGKFSLEIESVDPGALLQRLAASFKPIAEEKGVRLLERADPDLPQMPMDESRIAQVLTNLLNNAVKFTPEKGEIEVRAHLSKEDPAYLCFSVQDTGRGIAQEHLDRVFDRLYQVKDHAGGTSQGMGLGLHLCRGLVQLHGGEIRVESVVGEGSTFSFTLPLQQAAHGCRVLVVDDDPILCEASQCILEKAGYRVTAAHTGQAAIECMQTERHDLVLLDLVLPDLDGASILREIRKHWGSTPVIMHTGHPDHELLSRAMECSPFMLLTKPCPPQQLVDTVRCVQKQADTVLWLRRPKGPIAA